MTPKLFSIVILAAVLISQEQAMAAAPTWAQDCEKAGKASAAACQAASNGATAADNAQGAANQAQFAGSSQIQNPSGALQQQGQQQAARMNAAKAKCEEEKQKCSNKCDQEERDRASRAGGPPTDPIANAARAQSGQVEQKKQSACIAPIMAMMGSLGSAAANAAQAAQQAAATKGASGGGMMPLPIPLPGGGGGDDSEEPPVDPKKPDTFQLNCEQEANAKYSDCNNHYISKCGSAMTAPGCEPFIHRYCAQNPATPPAGGTDGIAVTPQNSAAANLVSDKQGEGLGSAFCTKANAYKFCQMAGRSECPSCKNLNSPWPSQNATAMADAQKTCPTDPMFLDPAVQAQLNNNTTNPPTTNTGTVSTQLGGAGDDKIALAAQSAGGGGSGGMGGAQAGGAGGAGSAPNGALSEGVPNGLNMATGGGGGGGGYGAGSSNYEGSASGPGYQPASVNGSAARAPATAVAGVRDVAQQFGPNIFSIQSTTYRDLCSRGKLLHCR